MAWQDEMVPIVRALIDDVTSPVTYSDTRLEETIVISAQILNLNIAFNQTYTINVATTSISPDPTDVRDDAFINLVSIRAACFIYDSEFKTASRLGIRVTDGPSSIDVSGRLTSALTLSKKFQDMFEKAKIDYLAGNSIAGQAIMTPYTYENLDSQDNMV